RTHRPHLPLRDALPIYPPRARCAAFVECAVMGPQDFRGAHTMQPRPARRAADEPLTNPSPVHPDAKKSVGGVVRRSRGALSADSDRKSTRLNPSHVKIS